MTIHIPLPPLEFFTWLAVYFQFGVMYMAYTVVSENMKSTEMSLADVFWLMLISFALIPARFSMFAKKHYILARRRSQL